MTAEVLSVDTVIAGRPQNLDTVRIAWISTKLPLETRITMMMIGGDLSTWHGEKFCGKANMR